MYYITVLGCFQLQDILFPENLKSCRLSKYDSTKLFLQYKYFIFKRTQHLTIDIANRDRNSTPNTRVTELHRQRDLASWLPQ